MLPAAQPSDVRLNSFLIDHAQDASQLDEQTRQVGDRAKERLTLYATQGGCLRTKILEYFEKKPPVLATAWLCARNKGKGCDPSGG